MKLNPEAHTSHSLPLSDECMNKRVDSIMMPSQPDWRCGRKVWAMAMALLPMTLQVVLAEPGPASIESGVYQTAPGMTVEESGDRVPGGQRTVPFAATLTFDLDAATPSLSAVIYNAVLEGGAPFPLTVRSSSGFRLADGRYRFAGDYLQEVEPAGTQYGFDWQFSSAGGGRVVWNGVTGWYGGHAWQVTLSDIALVGGPTLIPEPATAALLWVGLGVLGMCQVSIRFACWGDANVSQAH